ncbi:hypothetical protein ABT189_13420 [Streptomyces sp900105755]|uniref:hypothetical protein n=1 Tax=Streptomyces sp. 900105755 TaxID=3154389 RepID=UPI00332E7D36
MTGFVTGRTRVLGEGVNAALGDEAEAPAGLDGRTGVATVAEAVLPDAMVRVRETVFVPAFGHTGLTA